MKSVRQRSSGLVASFWKPSVFSSSLKASTAAKARKMRWNLRRPPQQRRAGACVSALTTAKHAFARRVLLATARFPRGVAAGVDTQPGRV